jgi:hypothetical protein
MGQIGIKDQWVVEINNPDILPDELQEFSITEDADLGLPILQMIIDTHDESKVKALSEKGCEFEFGIGKESVTEVFKWKVEKCGGGEGSSGAGKFNLTVGAFLNNNDYLKKFRYATYKDTDNLKTSDEIITEMFSERYSDFTVQTKKFDDEMMWIQSGKSDRAFLEEVIWHSWYADNDLTLSSINRNMDVIWKPMSELKKVKGIVGNDDDSDYKASKYEYGQNEGFMTTWGGGKRIAPIYRQDQGSFDEEWNTVTPQVLKEGTSQKVPRFTESSWINDNVHKNWRKAEEQNRILRASLSAQYINFYFHTYQPLFPLDYVNVVYSKNDKAKTPVLPIQGEWLCIGSNLFMSSMTFQQRMLFTREAML